MQIRIGGVVPQPHPDIVAEPVCMRMVQFQGVSIQTVTIKGVSVSTEFDQTGLFQSKHTESVTTVSGYCGPSFYHGI